MEDTNTKLRMGGAVISSIAILYYLFEIEQQIENWISSEKISELTLCSEVYGLELWLLCQSIIWCISLVIFLLVFLLPHLFKLMLCFMYLVGPLFFLWTMFAVIVQAAFMQCCLEEKDKCENFYPFKHSANFIVLLIVSLLFSISVSVILISIILGAFWQQMRGYIFRYQNL